jgi:hypothetical protein
MDHKAKDRAMMEAMIPKNVKVLSLKKALSFFSFSIMCGEGALGEMICPDLTLITSGRTEGFCDTLGISDFLPTFICYPLFSNIIFNRPCL